MADYNPNQFQGVQPLRVTLADGSVWGTEEITDLRNKFNEVQSKNFENLTRLANERLRDSIRFRESVHSQFKELVDNGDLDVDTANEVLKQLDLDPIPVEYSWEATIIVRGHAHAASDSDLEDAIRDASVEMDAWGSEPAVTDVEVDEVEVDSFSADRA